VRYLIPLLLLTACVSYERAPVDLKELAEDVDARGVGSLTYVAAVQYAREHNPELKKRAVDARAAGLDIPATSLLVTTNTRQEHSRALFDLLDVLSLGPRGAAKDVARESRLAALAALVEAERVNAADIAEAFLVERTLRDLEVPDVPEALTYFHGAGLASETDRARIEQAQLVRAAEREMIAAERRANGAWLRSLLGLGSGPELDLSLPEGAFPQMPEPSRERLLDRPDLAVLLGRYKAADAAFKMAVREQYPSILVGGELTYGGNEGGGIFALRIPVGASRRARAAGERREGARLAIEAALLQAERQGTARGAEYVAAEANARAHRAAFAASTLDYASALHRIDIEPDAFGATARIAVETLRAAGERREAVVLEARARVRYAEAFGWPRTGEVR